MHIDALCLSILGGIQPGPLSQYIHSAIKGGIGDDGFIQRFQVMVWPDGKPEWNLVENTNLQTWEPYIQQIFQHLDQLQFSNRQPVTLEFNQEAQTLFDEWQKRHETRLRKGSLSSHMEAHLAKYKKLLPALCLIFEHMKAALTGQFSLEVTKECLEKALIWLEYFESHANRVYGSSSNAIHKTAADLIRRIQRGEVKVPFTVRDVYYGRHWSGLSNPTEVEEVLEYLVDKNYLKSLASQKTGKRESKKYWVHTRVLE